MEYCETGSTCGGDAAAAAHGACRRLRRRLASVAAGMCALGCFGSVELRPGEVDVVVDGKAPPAVRFAADELTNFLAQALGSAVPIVNSPSDRTAIVLGDNQWSRDAGIDVDSRPRDTLFVKTAPNRVYLAGRDAPRQNPLVSPSFSRSLERGTAFAVYAFLEDYAGVRFYFPGELGTVVPKADRIVVPDVDRAVTPDFSVREWYSGKRAYWFGKTENDAEGERMKRLEWLRLRMGTQKIPLCHGTRVFKYVERFGKTHPEYFSLNSNGSRTIESAVGHSGHLCWTSPVVEEIYQDVKAALTGKKPSDRGIPLANWGNNVDLENRIVDIMPQDGQPDCACENCQKAYSAGESPVWLATKSIAERLKAEGVKGTVTQMCYGRVRKVPEYDLPSNILVQVAVRGQWSTGSPDLIAGEKKQITDWMKKLGHKVWLWTYPGKHPSVGPDFDGIPQLSMHAWGKYYSDLADSIIGGFSESETDRFSFNYLNYYVYSRVCWDVKTDIDAVLDEHYRLMFGAAAAEMKELYTILETNWMTRLSGESKDTPIGPVAVVPSWKAIFTEIYPPAEVARLDGLVASALSKVRADSLEARRIRLISDEFVGSIKSAAKAYAERVAAVEGFRANAAEPIPLRVFSWRGHRPDIDRQMETKVRTWTDEKAIYATFTCEEPNMDKVVAKARPRDNGEIWADNSVEWYLCPTGDRCLYYHIGVNSDGAFFDNKNISLGTRGGSMDKDWGEGVTASVEKGERSWACTVSVPFAAIGGRPAEAVPTCFARNRVVNGIRGSALYVWGPESLNSFGNSENYGTVEYGAAPAKAAATQAGGVPFDVEFAKGLLSIPSESRNIPECNRATAFLREYLESRGVFCHVERTEEGRDALYASTVPGKTCDYGFVTHIDVVPAASPEQFEPKIVGDEIYARGACDTKVNAALIAQILVELKGKASVGAFFATDEDGCVGKVPTCTMLRRAGYAPTKMIFVGDTSGGDTNKLKIAQKGHWGFRLTAKGRGGHSSIPWKLDNAIPKVVDATQKLMAAYPKPPPDGGWCSTLAPTILSAGDAPNSIPGEASVTFSFRYIGKNDVEELRKLVVAETGIEPETLYCVPAVENNPDDPLIRDLFGAMCRRWTDTPPEMLKANVATDAFQFTDLNLPIVIYAPDSQGGHKPVESGSLRSAEEYLNFLIDWIQAERAEP